MTKVKFLQIQRMTTHCSQTTSSWNIKCSKQMQSSLGYNTQLSDPKKSQPFAIQSHLCRQNQKLQLTGLQILQHNATFAHFSKTTMSRATKFCTELPTIKRNTAVHPVKKSINKRPLYNKMQMRSGPQIVKISRKA